MIDISYYNEVKDIKNKFSERCCDFLVNHLNSVKDTLHYIFPDDIYNDLVLWLNNYYTNDFLISFRNIEEKINEYIDYYLRNNKILLSDNFDDIIRKDFNNIKLKELDTCKINFCNKLREKLKEITDNSPDIKYDIDSFERQISLNSSKLFRDYLECFGDYKKQWSNFAIKYKKDTQAQDIISQNYYYQYALIVEMMGYNLKYDNGKLYITTKNNGIIRLKKYDNDLKSIDESIWFHYNKKQNWYFGKDSNTGINLYYNNDGINIIDTNSNFSIMVTFGNDIEIKYNNTILSDYNDIYSVINYLRKNHNSLYNILLDSDLFKKYVNKYYDAPIDISDFNILSNNFAKVGYNLFVDNNYFYVQDEESMEIYQLVWDDKYFYFNSVENKDILFTKSMLSSNEFKYINKKKDLNIEIYGNAIYLHTSCFSCGFTFNDNELLSIFIDNVNKTGYKSGLSDVYTLNLFNEKCPSLIKAYNLDKKHNEKK